LDLLTDVDEIEYLMGKCKVVPMLNLVSRHEDVHFA